MTIRLSEEEKEKLDSYAKNKRMSRGKVLRELFNKEIGKKVTTRYKRLLDVPLILYIPINFEFYEKGLFESGIDLLNFYKYEPLGKMKYFPITVKYFNNMLDIWVDDEFKSRSQQIEHEGIGIQEETTKPFNYIYLINIKKTPHQYQGTLLTLDSALEYSAIANNNSIYNQLMEFKENEELRNHLFETKINEELEKYKNQENKPKYII